MATALTHLHPKWNHAHRQAGLALYKALLTGCKRGGFSDLQTLQITNVIKNRYRENQEVASKRILHTVFQAGYQAIDHFDAVERGDAKSKEYILDLLYRVQNRAKHPPSCDIDKVKLGKLNRERPGRETVQAPTEPARPRIRLEDRPLPLEKLTGRRHVPRMVSAAATPMLRFTKPQPAKMGPFIAARLKQRGRRHMRRYELIDQVYFGDLEDQWDDDMELLAARHGIDLQKSPNEGFWDDETSKALRDLDGLIQLELDKNTAMAAKMHAIILKEKALQLEERAERKRRYKSPP